MSTTTPTSPLASIEATLSADWQHVLSFFKTAEADIGAFLAKVGSGAEIFIADVEAAAQWVAGHLSIINATISTVQVAAAVVAPNNSTVAKVISDLQTGANDVAQLSSALSTGSATGAPTVVSDALTAIKAVSALSSLASAASQTITSLTASSPTATGSVSVSSPAAL